MKFHFMSLASLAAVSLFSLSGCEPQNEASANSVLKLVTNVDCELFLDRSGFVELKIKNTGTIAYNGSALVYVDINGNRESSPINESIPVGGTVDISVKVPSISAGDWTGGVGIANQGPTSVSCIG